MTFTTLRSYFTWVNVSLHAKEDSELSTGEDGEFSPLNYKQSFYRLISFLFLHFVKVIIDDFSIIQSHCLQHLRKVLSTLLNCEHVSHFEENQAFLGCSAGNCGCF